MGVLLLPPEKRAEPQKLFTWTGVYLENALELVRAVDEDDGAVESLTRVTRWNDAGEFIGYEWCVMYHHTKEIVVEEMC